MKTDDFARLALGASGLQRIMIVGLPQCLPLKQWSRAETLDEDSAARQLGGAFRAAQAALRMVVPDSGPGSLTIETETALVVISPLAQDAAAAFVFDRGAPLGLVRVQVEQLSGHLEGMVPQLKRAAAEERGPTKAPPAPTLRPSTTMPPFSGLPSPALATEVPAATSMTGVPLPVAATIFNGNSVPPNPVQASEDSEDGPRAVRLLELFRRCAQDPYASMVRLSLRTGLSFDELSKPEAMSEQSVETLGAAIREILGKMGKSDLGL